MKIVIRGGAEGQINRFRVIAVAPDGKEHDEALGHRRRYVASELHQKLNAAGYSVDKRTYAITFAFPGILAYRLWRGLFPAKGGKKASYVMLPSWLNTLLSRLLGLEARVMRAMDLPIGTSIFAVAKRV